MSMTRTNWLTLLLVLIVHASMVCAETVVVYEREMTTEEKAAPRVGYQDSPIKPTISIEEIKEMYRKAKTPRYVIKIEVIQDDVDKTKRRSRLYSIRPDYIRNVDQTKWVEANKDILPLKFDAERFRERHKYLSLVSFEQSIYYPGMKYAGYMSQEFVALKGEKRWGITVYDTGPYHVTTHELFRRLIESKYEGIESAVGLVYAYTGPELDPVNYPGFRNVNAAWISGDHYAVYVAGIGMELNEIMTELGNKYPSTLKAAPTNRMDWAKKEVNMRLEQLAKSWAGDENNDLFTAHVYALRRYTDCPLLTVDDLLAKTSDESRNQLYKDLDAWWKTNLDQTKWSDSRNRLVLLDDRGIEIDTVKVRKQREKEERDAIIPVFLANPMTKEEIAVARAELIQLFEDTWTEHAAKTAKHLKDQGSKVKWERTGKEEWALEVPADSELDDDRIHRTEFRNPVVKLSDKDPVVPLVARFSRRWFYSDNPKAFDSYEDVYHYNRMKKQWIRMWNE